jgi:hypothetical protein
MNEFDENKAFAILLTNLGKKKRTENLLTIAEYCIRLKERYNSWNELAKRIQINDERAHISAEMLREFGTLLDLPNEIRQMLKDDLITSVDIAYRISRLGHDVDKINLAKFTVEKNLSASDVRAIVEYKLQNPEITIEQAIQRVLESKSRVVTHHIVIMELSNLTLETLIKQAEKLGQTPDSLATTMLGKKWNKEWIMSAGMRGNDLIIKLSEEGFKSLLKSAKEANVQLKDLAERELRNLLLNTC